MSHSNKRKNRRATQESIVLYRVGGGRAGGKVSAHNGGAAGSVGLRDLSRHRYWKALAARASQWALHGNGATLQLTTPDLSAALPPPPRSYAKWTCRVASKRPKRPHSMRIFTFFRSRHLSTLRNRNYEHGLQLFPAFRLCMAA